MSAIVSDEFSAVHDIVLEEPEFVALIRPGMTEPEFELVRRAYALMWEFHGPQLRESGDSYVTHTFGVTKIAVIELGMLDAESVISAMLHDLVEDTDDEYITKSNPELARQQLYDQWGYPIAYHILLLSKAKWQTREEYFKDIKWRGSWRARGLKLADRLHNLRTLDACLRHKQIRKSQETLDHIVPMIDQLLGEIPQFHQEMPEDFAARIATARAEVLATCARYLENT